MTDILSKAFVEPRVLGAFASDRPSLQYSVIEDNGVKKLVIFVDPSVNTDLSGESWESPIISGNSAIEYLAGLPDTEYPGCPREIWVKEGTINPVWKAIGSDRRTSSVVLRGGVSLYGGFNPNWKVRKALRFPDRRLSRQGAMSPNRYVIRWISVRCSTVRWPEGTFIMW